MIFLQKLHKTITKKNLMLKYLLGQKIYVYTVTATLFFGDGGMGATYNCVWC